MSVPEEDMEEVTGHIRDFFITAAVLLSSFGISVLIQNFFATETMAALIFVMAVFITALTTDGYKWGVVAAILSVLAVNFAFTFPYFEFSISASENTLSCAVMLFVAVMTSMLTTKIKRQEKLKRETEREKIRADLLRAVSHDIRTPLTTIYGASSAVMDNYDLLSKEQKMKMLGGIKEESEWLIRMVENLLSVTKLDGGNISVVKAPVPLEELMDSVLTKFRKRYPGVEPEVSIPDDFVSIPMDPLLIEQVLLNLMENSVLHAEGMTKLAVSVEISDNKAMFEVKDDGCGMVSGNLEILMEPDAEDYVHTGKAVRDDRKSSGIGLSVCAAIVKAHGGVITAESGQDGTTVRFLLDMEESEHGEQ